MAIDSMVDLVFAARRMQRNGNQGWSAWVKAREEQWRGIIYSDVTIAAGFAIFAFSSFPPTQRFGLVEVEGRNARLYVHAEQPCLIVDDLRLDPQAGGVALWVGPGTEGYFSNLQITAK
jgi:hypothetical protein